ncbi:MAG: hypothetical protein NE327_21195 [Lentisphaeraceae bacterium]|nr:hypothetical protein [Lentisphaeraceae bacterium]
MTDDYLRTYKRLGILFLATLFGLWNGCTDISYMFSSEKTMAKVTNYFKIQGPKSTSTTNKNVSFKFTDKDGKECKGYDSVDINWQPKNPDGTVEIAYIPGKMRVSGGNTEARLTENSSVSGLFIFFIAGSLFSFYLYIFYRDMQSAPST